MLVFLVIFPFLLHCARCNTCYKDDNKDCVQDEFSKINGASGAFVIGEGNREGLEDGEDTEKKRFMKILKACGELCDMKRKGTPGKFMNQMRSKVNCKAIFKTKEIDMAASGPPLQWKNIPKVFKKHFTLGGDVKVYNWFRNDANIGSAMEGRHKIGLKDLTDFVNLAKSGKLLETFIGGSESRAHYKRMLENFERAINESVPVAGKHILIIGSQTLWMEAMLLARGAAKLTTLEYAPFTSGHPQLEFLQPNDFRLQYLNGKLPVFDAVFTYSSIEHSGLGRYGDAINPWGDVLTIARAWCASSPTAHLAIGVPTLSKDFLSFNAHRIYGPRRYPLLTTNWNLVWKSTSQEALSEYHSDNMFQQKNAGEFDADDVQPTNIHEPIFVFQKSI